MSLKPSIKPSDFTKSKKLSSEQSSEENFNVGTCITAETKNELGTLIDEAKGNESVGKIEAKTSLDADCQMACLETDASKTILGKEAKAKLCKLNSQLLIAAELGDLAKVKDTLDPEKNDGLTADPNAKGLNDFTPLHDAVSEGHFEVVKCLLMNGADLNAKTTGERTPLHLACYNGNKELIELLIVKGADINIQESEGNTPSHILAECGWIECLSLLLQYGPELTTKNHYGLTAPEISASVEIKKQFPLVRLKRGYDRTIINNLLLHNNRVDIIKLLIFKNKFMENAIKDSRKEELKSQPERQLEVAKRRAKLWEALRRIKNGIKLLPEEYKGVRATDFQPIKLLGKGSFGQVYLVRHKSSNKLYAMKVLTKARFMVKNLMKYAMSERNLMTSANHPFIIRLYSTFQTSERLFFIIDYCPGYFLPIMH